MWAGLRLRSSAAPDVRHGEWLGGRMPEWTPLLPTDPAEVGPYRIEGRLGTGGQGAVYVGRTASGERVAVKLLHPHLVIDERARARFLREVEIAKRVVPFSTAQVLDSGVVNGQPYIVSEFVDGPSLHESVRGTGPRGAAALERLALNTATALAAIHQSGIVHRDFKPGNVLLGPDGPVVIDFGIARALDVSRSLTAGQIVGTPGYMAPEQFSDHEVGPAADLFAWGATMVFAATGEPAFGGDSLPAVMRSILEDEPHLDGLDGRLAPLVRACLAKDPADRPTSAEVVDSLRALPGQARQPIGPPPTRQDTAALSPEPAEPAERPGHSDAPTVADEPGGRRGDAPSDAEPDRDATTTRPSGNAGVHRRVWAGRGLLALALLAVLGLGYVVFPGLGGDDGAEAAPLVGVTLPHPFSERWTNDGDRLKSKLEQLGYRVDLQYTDDAAAQADEIDDQIGEGARLLIVASAGDPAIAERLRAAAGKNIPVIAYDLLVRDSPDIDYYTSFDQREVGRQQATSLLVGLGLRKPDGSGGPARGSFAIELFAGSPEDPSARSFFDGAMDVLKRYIDSERLVVESGQTDFGTVATMRWDATTAGKRMDDLITRHYGGGTTVQGVLSPYDGLSRSILSALESRGYGTRERPYPVITGQGAEAESVRSIIAGEQYSTVLNDTRRLADTTAKLADTLLKGDEPQVTGTQDNGAKTVPAYLLEPVTVDKGNYEQQLIATGYYTESQVR